MRSRSFSKRIFQTKKPVLCTHAVTEFCISYAKNNECSDNNSLAIFPNLDFIIYKASIKAHKELKELKRSLTKFYKCFSDSSFCSSTANIVCNLN